MSEQQGTFQSWAVLELLGHVRTAGLVSEQELFGTKMGRIDIPTADGFVTQFFGGSSVYRLTPTTEEIARSVAARNQPAPVHRWELPKPQVEQQEIPYYEPTEGHNHRKRSRGLPASAGRGMERNAEAMAEGPKANNKDLCLSRVECIIWS